MREQVVLNNRSCAHSTLRTSTAYCAAWTHDIRHVVASLSQRYPSAPLVACGFSLGANMLCKYLGEMGSACPLRAAVSVSNPCDLQAASAMMAKGLGPLYDLVLARGLVRHFSPHKEMVTRDVGGATAALQQEWEAGLARQGEGGAIGVRQEGGGRRAAHHIYPGGSVLWDAAAASTTVRDFDDRITRHAFGFDSVEDYYTRASSAGWLGSVGIPLACFWAEDDYMIDVPHVTRDKGLYLQSPNLVLALSRRGGHVGWSSCPNLPATTTSPHPTPTYTRNATPPTRRCP
jgi:predicted alpha/beta-fold hydrolase